MTSCLVIVGSIVLLSCFMQKKPNFDLISAWRGSLVQFQHIIISYINQQDKRKNKTLSLCVHVKLVSWSSDIGWKCEVVSPAVHYKVH